MSFYKRSSSGLCHRFSWQWWDDLSHLTNPCPHQFWTVERSIPSNNQWWVRYLNICLFSTLSLPFFFSSFCNLSSPNEHKVSVAGVALLGGNQLLGHKIWMKCLALQWAPWDRRVAPHLNKTFTHYMLTIKDRTPGLWGFWGVVALLSWVCCCRTGPFRSCAWFRWLAGWSP